jgi:hypothetical protein
MTSTRAEKSSDVNEIIKKAADSSSVSNIKEEKKIIEPQKPVFNETVQPTGKEDEKKTVVLIPNSNCLNNASEDDFIKLRRKMIAEDKEDDMVNVARKQFKLKCFTVEQIKNLSVILLTEDGKYHFFDAAYPYASDSGNFYLLESELKDAYYINRFKSMLRH